MKGILYLLLASVIWSTTPIFAKVAYSAGTGPVELVEVRLFLGLIFMVGFYRGRIEVGCIRANLKPLFILALFGMAANYVLYHQGIYYTSASAAQVLESTAPFFIMVLALLMKEEELDTPKVLGSLLVVAGALVIFYYHLDAPGNLLGDGLEILAALTWGFFVVMSARTLRTLDSVTSLVAVFGISFFLILPLALFGSVELSLSGSLVGVSMGFVHTFLAYYLYFEGIRLTRSPILSGVIFSLSPILTIFWEALFLGISAGAGFYLGALVLLIGVMVVAIRPR
jgi:drug/metabolite transporter (DMT)-like permease